MQNTNFLNPDIIVEYPKSFEMIDEMLAIQQIKNEITIRLLQDWMIDESGYDEKTWEVVKETLEENRLSSRRIFND